MKESVPAGQEERFCVLQQWVSKVLPGVGNRIKPLTSDASFRRYFRVQLKDETWVVMDAPPDKESCEPFAAIAAAWGQLNLKVPEIYASDFKQGFLLLSDFGDNLYLSALNDQTADILYQNAFDNLLIIQQCQDIPGYSLPNFDANLYWQEMNLFTQWYLPYFCKATLNSDEKELYKKTGDLLISSALQQPQVCVHRDYHSRNLMVLPNNYVGILDFQDALWGPITYDLMSLMRDCYIQWQDSKINGWIKRYYQSCLDNHLLDPNITFLQFIRWFDWMTLQRNLKCLGIFARLYVRDGKGKYLKDIPRVLTYALNVCQKYQELQDLVGILKKGEQP